MPKPWRKLWVEKMLGSPRIRALKPYDRGIYFTMLCMANDEGALRSAQHVYTIKDIANESNANRALKRVTKAVEHFVEVGIVAKGPDGELVVSNLAELQKHDAVRRARRRPGGGRRPRGGGPQSIGDILGQ